MIPLHNKSKHIIYITLASRCCNADILHKSYSLYRPFHSSLPRYAPGGGTKNAFFLTEKLVRRILYPFYTKELYSKLYLPEQQTVIHSIKNWAKLYENKQVFMTTLRSIWQYKNLYQVQLNKLKDFPELEETLSSVYNALKYNKPLIIKNVSGIWQPSQSFLSDDTFITELLCKTVINLFHGNPVQSSEDLISRIGQTICPVDFLDNADYYPAVQHILNSILVSNSFDIQHVAQINPLIDYTSYKNSLVKVQLILESFVVKHTLTDLMNLNIHDHKYIAQNPDNPLGDHVLYSSIAYDQMKQPHPDYRKDVITIPNKPKFFDSKLKSQPLTKLSLNRGHLSLTTSLHDNNKMFLMKRSLADYKGSVTQKAKNQLISEEDEQYMNNVIKGFSSIIADKTLQTNQKFDAFRNKQHIVNLDSHASFVCSYIAKPPVDSDYVTFYEHYLKGNYDKEAIIKGMQIHKHNLFPSQGQYVDKIAWEKMIRVIINALPKNVKKVVEYNYDTVKALEI